MKQQQGQTQRRKVSDDVLLHRRVQAKSAGGTSLGYRTSIHRWQARVPGQATAPTKRLFRRLRDAKELRLT